MFDVEKRIEKHFDPNMRPADAENLIFLHSCLGLFSSEHRPPDFKCGRASPILVLVENL
jgi:hypothetical protein